MKQWRQFAQLLRYLRPYRRLFYGALLATVISVGLNALWPVIMGLAITEIGNNLAAHVAINFDYIQKVIVLIILEALGYQITLFLSSWWMTLAVQRAMRDLRAALTDKIDRLPVSYFDAHQQGNLLSRVTNDVDAITNAFQQSFIQIVTSIVGIISAVIMMVLINPLMTLLSLIMIPLSLGISRAIVHYSQPYFKGQQNALGDLNGYIQENYTGFTVLKVFGQENQAIEKFRTVNHALADQGFKAAFISGLMMPLVGMTANMTYAAMAMLGGYNVVAGIISLGNLQAFIQYIWQVNQPLSSLTQLAGVMQSAGAATARVFEVLNASDAPQQRTSAQLPTPVLGRVSFNDVSFAYHQDQPLIKHLSFVANPGDTVAIVGPTGAGKTTLINLLMRFYDVDAGAIEIDGVNTQSLTADVVRKQFGMVLQDAWLYHTTIADNIRLGRIDATDYEVVDAAKTANVDHFIRTLPDGYQMVIDEEAQNVSLGQKQLLTIARAVIADPKILILDEATSSVDTRLEGLLQTAMDRVMQGRTSFVIAHRLSTIRNADLILVMNHGEIIEQGTHTSLLADNGFYAKLYQSQFGDADDPV
ncbi:ABC transporter ATP-binding protein [Lacticaseibacillus brantae]|uniref:ABC transporter transmembrane region family protein n=1 Tax=Lacticaseibacillus brantae DSM 23927 TaxID=1423727 RepID=A0A0R2B856_9LACO|nr:ABC transporter ATP-binding protein [Lacticaseibacillus brantae]KRM72537.1 ABC transporter transmembrane region family protein [Lacticaseibacillus brantae DSM 23927]